jgi:hypothetical protein
LTKEFQNGKESKQPDKTKKRLTPTSPRIPKKWIFWIQDAEFSGLKRWVV